MSKTQKVRCYEKVADELEKIAASNGLKTMADTIAFVVKEFDNIREIGGSSGSTLADIGGSSGSTLADIGGSSGSTLADIGGSSVNTSSLTELEDIPFEQWSNEDKIAWYKGAADSGSISIAAAEAEIAALKEPKPKIRMI